MSEELLECGVCDCIYRITINNCPRCGATNFFRKKYHGGFFDAKDAVTNNDYQKHNSYYNVHHSIKHVAYDGVIRRDVGDAP